MRTTFFAFFLAFAACSPTPPGPPPVVDAGPDCGPNGATLAVGTGTDSTIRSYRPVSDGDVVYLTPGPQGGQHVWIGLRATGIDPAQPRIEMRAYRASDNTIMGELRIRLRFVPTDDDPNVYALPAQTLFVENEFYCSVLPGDIRVTIDFNDYAGHCFHVERRLRLAGVDPLTPDSVREATVRCCTERLRRCFPDGGVSPSGDAGMAMATRDAGETDAAEMDATAD